jgi:hypothetical protein
MAQNQKTKTETKTKTQRFEKFAAPALVMSRAARNHSQIVLVTRIKRSKITIFVSERRFQTASHTGAGVEKRHARDEKSARSQGS